ncbi:hypothetical protein DWW03_12570 [Alistipes sp. AF14-19]|nr:hypothetical protein DWW03_12570 [Alistipes sp. AF14-19]
MPAQETVRASFFCAGTAARGGSCLRGGLFMGWSVCGIVYGTDSLRLRNLFKDEVRAGTGEPDRETGKQGIGESGNRGIGESGAEVRSVSGQWSDRSANRRPVCRPDVSGAGRMAFFAFAEIFTADFLHRAQ